MKRAIHLIPLVVLFVLVSAVQGQTPTTAVDYYNRGNGREDVVWIPIAGLAPAEPSALCPLGIAHDDLRAAD